MGLLRGVAGTVEGYGSGDDDGAVEGYSSGDDDGAVDGCGSGDSDGAVSAEENSNGGDEFLVLQAIQCLPLGSDVSLELLLRDISKDQKVEKFMSTGCSCTKWKGKSCSLQLTKDYV